ncbi:DUF6443 domain-containing protein, partial [Flavobacterium sp.]|uniref:DUF6443 domain-containing protein n=1 Tax=Flavobacterium sp. TaxID=239 RepID=UPI00391AAD38
MPKAAINILGIWKIVFFTILFLNFSILEAKEKKWEQQISGSQIQTGSVISIFDPEIAMTNTNSVSKRTFIEIKIDDFEAPYYWYECELKLRITPILDNGNPSSTYDIGLMVQNNHYGNFGNFVDLNKHLVVQGLRGAIVEVISFTVLNKDTNTNENSVPDNVHMIVSFETERYYDLSATSIPVLQPYALLNSTNNTLNISWQNIPEAEAYELEWTWVDNFGLTLSSVLQPHQIALSRREFELNNTRIQTANITYSIPLVYDKGYIVYRVRPIGRFLADTSKKYEGLWSMDAPTVQTVSDWGDFIEVTNHNNINWQFQSSYAENGKKKEVVSYFDGSLRNRQTVTRINTNDKVIVGEVVYDEEGRPAVEVLPVPTEGTKIEYYPDFNRNTDEKVYSYQDLDSISQNCNIVADGMSKISGASKYYSSNNSVENSYQDFVPVAHRYPFSQTEYELDNTGRVKKKGGLGPDHQLGSNHEMKYFYSVPTQEELNRLFGYSVGFVSHYKKNIVVDPNGQASVSYLDPQGRTIATGLSSGTPTNLSPLEDEGNSSLHTRVTTDLLNKLSVDDTDTSLDNNTKYLSSSYWSNYFDGLKYEAQKVFITSGGYDFYYKMNKPDAFSINCGNETYNYPFIYKLKLDVTDDCGVLKNPYNTFNITGNDITIVPDVEATLQDESTIIIGDYDTIPDDPNTPAFDPGIELVSANQNSIFDSPGSPAITFTVNNQSIRAYGISKKLDIDQIALELFANDYIRRGILAGCILGPQDPVIDSTGCFYSCADCENHFNNLQFVVGETPYTGKNAYVQQMLSTNFDLLQIEDVLSLEYSTLREMLIARYEREWDLYIIGCNEPCNNGTTNQGVISSSISCENNLEVLRSDMLPSGQYGIFISDIDSNGDVVSDSASTSTSIPDLVSNNPLTVYNDDTTFNRIYSIVPGTNQTQINWRHPHYFDADQIITALNPNAVNDDYKHYFTETGEIDYVIITLDEETETFNPPLLSNVVYGPNNQTNIHAIPVDAEAGIYKVEPQYLANVEDFVNLINSRDHWSQSLVKYHPEFHYLDYQYKTCKMTLTTGAFSIDAGDSQDEITLNSDGFDMLLGSKSTFQEAFDAGFFSSKTAFFDNDPFFQIPHEFDGFVHTVTNENDPDVETDTLVSKLDMLQVKRAIMYQALKKDNDPLTTSITNISLGSDFVTTTTPELQKGYDDTNYELAVYVYRVSFCNAPGFTCSITNFTDVINSVSTMVPTQQDLFWRNYVSYYIGLKQKIQHVFINLYAARQGFYNDCIGNNGNQNLNKIKTIINDYPKAKNRVGGWIIQPSPNLHSENRLLLRDNIKRFIPYDGSHDSTSSAQQIYEDMMDTTGTQNYLDTGVCPMVRDLQIFLNNAPSRPGMDQVFQGSSSPTPTPIVNFITPDLLEAIGGNYSNELTISGSVSGQTLSLNFAQGLGVTIAPITLTLPTNSYTGSGWSAFGYNTTSTWVITEMHHLTFDHYDTSVPGLVISHFSVVAKIVSTDPAVTNTTYPFREIILTGTVKAILTCTSNSSDLVDGSNTNPIYLDPSNSFDCNKKELFANGLKDLIVGLQAANQVNNNYFITNFAPFTSNYLYSYFGVRPGDSVEWKGFGGTSQSYELYINTILRFTISSNSTLSNGWLGHPLVSIGIDNVYLGGLTGLPLSSIAIPGVSSGHNFHATLETSPDTFVQIVGDIFRGGASGAYGGKAPLYFECCSPCGEWDYDGDGRGDDGFFGENSCDRCDNRDNPQDACTYTVCEPINTDTDSDSIDDACDNCVGTANYNQNNFDGDHYGDLCDSNPDYGMCFNDDNGVKAAFEARLKSAINGIIGDTSVVNSNGFSGIVSINDVSNLAQPSGFHLPFCFSRVSGGVIQEPVVLASFRYKKVNNFPMVMRWHSDSNPNSYNSGTYYDIMFLGEPEFESNVLSISQVAILPANNPYTDASNEVLIRGSYENNTQFEITIPIKVQRVSPELGAFSENICEFLRSSDINTTLSPVVAPIGDYTCNCIPQVPIICSSSDMYFLYLQKKNDFPALALTSYTLEEFANLNLQFITEGYLDYLLALNIDSTDDPYYLTLAGFGATVLNYGFNDYETVITQFQQYVGSMNGSNFTPFTVLNGEGETIEVNSWGQFANYFLQHNPDICPPQPMIPIIEATVVMENPCIDFLFNAAETYNSEAYAAYISALKLAFKKAYLEEGLGEVIENLTMTYDDKEYQYTLYYYDQGGNLIQTVAPEGIDRLNLDVAQNDIIDNSRINDNENGLLPSHTFKTKYRYNSLNQLVWQSTPDGGETRFAYDGLGRIVASQNDKQRNPQIEINPSLNLQSHLTSGFNTVFNSSSSFDWKYAGGISMGTVGSSGYAEHTIIIDDLHPIRTTEQIIFGLSYSNSVDNDNVYYGFYYMDNGQFTLRSGLENYGPTYTLANGDKFKIERINEKVRFYQNGVLLHEIVDPEPGVLTIVDFAIKNPGSMLNNIKIVNYKNFDFSYTCYDKLGRIVEAGQLLTDQLSTFINDDGRLVDDNNDLVGVDSIVDNYPHNISKNQIEVTKTLYDSYEPFNPNSYLTAQSIRNTRNRVTAILTFAKTIVSTPLTENETAIFYNYDIHGNVDEMAQRVSPDILYVDAYPSGVVKRVNYEYDLISGNVNKVIYQKGVDKDQFIHKYNYDADNRITAVETSRDNVIWEKDATYEYYDHGPLARVITGDKKVQGTDYAYTIQGWIKTVNSENLSNSNKDMGNDGQHVSKDAYGYSLTYFDSDYKARHLGSNEGYYISNNAPTQGGNLFNGNINRMITSVRGIKEEILPTQINLYTYDQLNRIFSLRSKSGIQVNDTFPYDDSYHSDYTYDRNGNLKTLKRSAPLSADAYATEMDDFSYHYISSTNQLSFIKDNVSENTFSDDIDNQLDNNYHYDEIGQLIKDEAEKIDKIDWRVDGKVKSIEKNSGSLFINFFYDGLGNRVAKQVTSGENSTLTTHYTRDAQGNVMGVYSLISAPDKKIEYNLSEHHIYGSSRLGLQQYEFFKAPKYFYRLVGDKRYELTNHLGNVLSVINDRKIVNTDVNLLHSDFFNESSLWSRFNMAEAYITSERELEVLVYGDNSGCKRDFSFESNAPITFQLKVNRPDNFPSNTPITFAVRNPSDDSIIWSTLVPESGIIAHNFTTTYSGDYRITVTTNGQLGETVIFTMDDFYVYQLPTSNTDYLSLYLPDVLNYNDYYPFGSLV